MRHSISGETLRKAGFPLAPDDEVIEVQAGVCSEMQTDSYGVADGATGKPVANRGEAQENNRGGAGFVRTTPDGRRRLSWPLHFP